MPGAYPPRAAHPGLDPLGFGELGVSGPLGYPNFGEGEWIKRRRGPQDLREDWKVAKAMTLSA